MVGVVVCANRPYRANKSVGTTQKKNVDTTSASTLYCTVCPEASQDEVRLVAMGDIDCKWLTDIAVGVECCQHENLEVTARLGNFV